MTTTQPNNPLHGITLQTILTELVAYYKREGLSEIIQVNCFMHHPSIKSSLTFLRKTPRARQKVEELYLDLPDGRQAGKTVRNHNFLNHIHQHITNF